ncbi:MAG: hypothetical protein ABI462_03695 [Ignavibacteria bacterium]
MKLIFKIFLLTAAVCLMNLGINNYSKAGGFGDLDTLDGRIDNIINCIKTDTNCLDIAWGNHVINDASIHTLDSIMTVLLIRQDVNISNIDSLTIEITIMRREIDSATINHKPVSSTTFTEYYDTRKVRNSEQTISRKLDRMIRKIEYFFDLGTLNSIVMKP